MMLIIRAEGLNVSGLERKISMRTSKEELIQRGILMPGDPNSVTSISSPMMSSSSGLTETASRSSTPRLNLPHLASHHKSGRSSAIDRDKVCIKQPLLCIDWGIVPVLKLGPLSNINNGTEGLNSANNGRTSEPDHRFLNITGIAAVAAPGPILSWPKS